MLTNESTRKDLDLIVAIKERENFLFQLRDFEDKSSKQEELLRQNQ